MQLPVHNAKGEQVSTIDVADEVFGIEPNHGVMHQAFLAVMANRRMGSSSTKTRGEVRGSTAKIRRQKGLGRSRQGSIRAPHHRGGGITFGPKPRSYAQSFPKMMRRLAIRSVLSGKLAAGVLRVVEDIDLRAPRTSAIKALLDANGIDRSTVLATGGPHYQLQLSTRNIEGALAMPAALLNVADLLNHRYLVLEVAAVRTLEALHGGARAKKRLAPVAEVS